MPIEGVVDRIRPRYVSGWVFSPEHPDAHLQVTVRLGDWIVGSATANQYRPDLEAGGIGRGDHSYDVALETELSAVQFHQVQVEAMTREGESEILGFGPDALRNVGTTNGMFLYAEAAELLPPVGYPAEIIDTALLDRYVTWTRLPRDEMTEKVRRDTWPIPHSNNREGYDPDSSFSYWLIGYIDSQNIQDLARKHGVSCGRYLDFGGSTGRIFRHFATQTDAWDVWTCDFKASSVEFNLKYFPARIRPFLNTSFPSLPLPDEYFDLITACSVFTHIDEAETSWLLELRRLLKIGGLACISIHNGATWTDMVPELRATVERFRPEIANEPTLPADRLVVTFRDDGDPYKCNTFHSDNYIRQNWGRYFDIRDIQPHFLGEQAMVVCQRAG